MWDVGGGWAYREAWRRFSLRLFLVSFLCLLLCIFGAEERYGDMERSRRVGCMVLGT